MAFSTFFIYVIMKSKSFFVLSVCATALATALLYKPASLVVYKIREPYFSYPVRLESRGIMIRNDAEGDGEFGAKRRNGRAHSGIDIQAPIGTPVYASKSGIAFCGNVPTGYGRYVMIYHPDGFQTMYGHLSNWNTFSTKAVRKGEMIGFVGKSGNAGGKLIQSHLHFEIRKAGEPQVPLPLMR